MEKLAIGLASTMKGASALLLLVRREVISATGQVGALRWLDFDYRACLSLSALNVVSLQYILSLFD